MENKDEFIEVCIPKRSTQKETEELILITKDSYEHNISLEKYKKLTIESIFYLEKIPNFIKFIFDIPQMSYWKEELKNVL